MIAEKDSKMMDIEISTDVLVIGQGASGIDSATTIANQGYKVLFLNPSDAAVDSGVLPEGIEVISGAAVAELGGAAGDFRARLTTASGNVEKTFGAVVVAPEYRLTALNDAYGLTLGDRVVTQSQMEAMLADPDKKAALSAEEACVAFLTGFGQEGTPETTGRVLKAALDIQTLEGCKSYIYAGNVKVGAKGLERLFTQGRHQGVVCFKPTEKPVVEPDADGIKIRITDPVVRTDVELVPDYIVVEEALVVDQKDKDLTEVLRIDVDGDGFVPSNNVHRFPARSNREGIYIASAPGDPANVALRVKEFLGTGVKTVSRAKAEISDKCVICLTCYRSCPHGAIYWEEGKAVISPVACQGCGICASECPMDAIQIGDYTDASLRGSIAQALESAADQKAIVAFCCENSGMEAGQAARMFGAELPEGLRMIQVPCAGKVEVDLIMNALVEGAEGVMVVACHEGNCKAERGNIFARWRTEEIRKRLESMGLNKDRVRFVTTAANMADDFASKVSAFAESL